MKLGFHFLCFYSCLIGILSFSTQEMPNSLTTLLNEPIIEDSNAHKKEHQEKEFPKEEEEENQRKEKEEEDSSEDIEIEEEFSKQSPNLPSTVIYFEKLTHSQEELLNSHSNTTYSYYLQSYPPFYILFASLKIDC